MDFTHCPTCSTAAVPYSTVDFTLTSASDNVASGSITASSDPQDYAVGVPVTATLATESFGPTMSSAINGIQGGGLFCTAANTHMCGD